LIANLIILLKHCHTYITDFLHKHINIVTYKHCYSAGPFQLLFQMPFNIVHSPRCAHQ